MGLIVVILLVIILVVVVKGFSKQSSGNTTRYTDTSLSRYASDTVISSNRVKLYTDEITKKAFISYIFASVFNNDIQNPKMASDEGILWAKARIEQAWLHITTGSCVNYLQAGKFNVYQGQTLTPENKVYMDLFEILLYGDNDFSKNRANELSNEDANKIRINLWTLNLMLTSNEGEIRQQKLEGAAAYDDVFGT